MRNDLPIPREPRADADNRPDSQQNAAKVGHTRGDGI